MKVYILKANNAAKRSGRQYNTGNVSATADIIQYNTTEKQAVQALGKSATADIIQYNTTQHPDSSAALNICYSRHYSI